MDLAAGNPRQAPSLTLARSGSAAVGVHPLRSPAHATVEQCHRLREAVPEQRLELIDGEVLQVIAKGIGQMLSRHA